MQPQIQAPKQYFPALDVLRFFAAGWVVLFHYFLFFGGQVHFYRYGNLGVQLFFIISGFVIAESIQGKSLKQFAFGRWARLFPLFWIACTLTYIVTLFAGTGIHFSTYLIDMTIIGYNAVPNEAVDAVYWSLTVELFFYMFIGLFVYVFKYKNIRFFYWLWALVATVFFSFGISNHMIGKLLLIRHASYFIFGGMLFLIINAYLKKEKQKALDVCLLVYIAVLSVVVLPVSNPPYFVPNVADGFYVRLIHVLYFVSVPILLLAFRSTSKKVAKVTLLLGGLTYPLYLIHQRIGLIVIDAIKGVVGKGFATFIVIVAVLLASYGLYKLDRKISRYLKRFAPQSTEVR